MMKKRTLVFLGVGLALAAGIWFSREGLSHRALASVLGNPAPTDTAMDAFLSTAPDVPAAVTQLWNSGRIPQRAYALNYLIRHAKDNAALWQASRPWVISATTVADSEMQAIALELLTDHKDDRAIPAAGAYLESADPDVRITGLMRLNDLHDTKWAATFARMLDDPDAKVRTIAASSMRNLTGEDFGVHLAAATQTNDDGIAQWKKWWTAHSNKYDPAQTLESPTAEAPGAAFPFTLPTLDGKQVSLSDFRGKVVLLNFWATWCPSCVAELQALGDLQRAHPNDLVILGMNLDGVTDGDDGDAKLDDKVLAGIRVDVTKAVTDAKIGYVTLLDPNGKTLGPYGAGALPESVLIGRDGTVKRRLLGARTNEIWDALIAEAGK